MGTGECRVLLMNSWEQQWPGNNPVVFIMKDTIHLSQKTYRWSHVPCLYEYLVNVMRVKSPAANCGGFDCVWKTVA